MFYKYICLFFVLSETARKDVLCNLLYDLLVLMDESMQPLERDFINWKSESKGLNVNMEKKEVMDVND